MKNRKALAALVAAAFLFLSGPPAQAVTEADIQQMKQEMKALQKQLHEMRKIIERQEKELKTLKEKPKPAGRAAAGKSQDTTTLTGISRSLNPAISINGLFLRAASKNQREDDPAPGFFVQEFELQATAFIGPTVKGNLIIREGGREQRVRIRPGRRILRHLRHPDGPHARRGDEPDRAGASLRIGKAFVPFGKHNPLHTHQFPFIDRPVVLKQVFGEEALNEVQGLFSYSPPFIPVFTEFQGAAMAGANDELFNSPGRRIWRDSCAGGPSWTLPPTPRRSWRPPTPGGTTRASRRTRWPGET